ncbi:MAG: hypothetical protein FIB00_00375 [Chloroflexi bacterium]|nr:hypothetical protein [Chloroflexota bacterium]PWB43192.1 MAG: hypothetical protein C3F10_10855 [Dehalococcoidia bacterium]
MIILPLLLGGKAPVARPGGGGRRLSVFGSVIEPADLWREIVDRHCRAISPPEARILALLVQGYRSEEAALLMGVSGATIRRHVAELSHRVFEFTEVPHEHEKLRVWAREHLTCCVPLVYEMIENDRNFV